MSRSEQLSLTRERPALDDWSGFSATPAQDAVEAEASARRVLRGQIARLERELSAVVAEGFPGIARSALEGAG